MATRPLRNEDLACLAEEIERDPIFFAREVLGHDYWGTQAAIAQAMARPRARVAVKACHASSKTFTAADLVQWWTITGGIVVTTASTWEQVKRLLWGEIHRSYAAARFPLGGTLLQTELKLGPECYAIGLSTNEGVRFQGFHGKVLIVIDEAPGVRPDIWEAIEGIRAGGDVRVLALGNPTIPSGPFYDAFTTGRASWQTFTIDAFETPNLAGLSLPALLALPEAELDIAPRPYLIGRRYVKEKYEEVGEQSALWQARVRGQFPDQAEDALISLAWLEAAKARVVASDATDRWQAGIDVAGPGEAETVLVIRQGARVVSLQAWGEPDPRGKVLAALEPYRQHLTRIAVDTIGIGHYFAKHLEDHGWQGIVQAINVGEAAPHKERYANLKAELYWGLRLRFEQGDVAGLTDERTIAQLAALRYEHTARGQVAIESKDDARKRGVPSPDRAEALMLAFADHSTGRFRMAFA